MADYRTEKAIEIGARIDRLRRDLETAESEMRALFEGKSAPTKTATIEANEVGSTDS